jgi:hypothetical protein
VKIKQEIRPRGQPPEGCSMTDQSYNPRGRGAIENPTNRFQSIDFTWDEDFDPAERPAPRTQFLRDVSKTIIATNDSPDVGFEASLNPYRGCEHGCVYCYARPTHEYLGFSAGLDFESRIMVKEDAPQLLRAALMKPGWEPKVVVMSGVTDCYQRAQAAADARLPGSLRRVSQSGGDHHQEPPCDAGHRYILRAGKVSSDSSEYFGDDAG